MSATAPPDPGLAGAREELVRRGYLRERGEPSRPGARAAAWLVVFAALGSLVVAAGQVSAARAEPVLVVPLFAGYLPIVLVLTGLAAGLGIWAARTLLGLGGQPETVAEHAGGRCRSRRRRGRERPPDRVGCAADRAAPRPRVRGALRRGGRGGCAPRPPGAPRVPARVR